MKYELEQVRMQPYTDLAASRFVPTEGSLRIAPTTDIVLIRPPHGVPEYEIASLAEQLVTLQFAPIILPVSRGIELIDADRFFPTDRVRTIGPWIFHSLEENFESFAQAIPGKYVPPDNQKRVSMYFRGGDFIYSTRHKIFIYSDNWIFQKDNPFVNLDKASIAFLSAKGWTCMKLKKYRSELDFTQSLFTGRDGRLHTLIAYDSLPLLLPQEQKLITMTVHTIPEAEVIRGGCNVADCRNGSVLILPNRADAPTTYGVVTQFAHPSIRILESPPNFFEHQSGPRCAISDFPIVG